MATMYRKDGRLCKADPEQIVAMEKSGWSRKKPKYWDEVNAELADEEKPVKVKERKNRVRQIIDAIKSLDDNVANFIADGKTPSITAIEHVLKFEIDTDERGIALETIRVEAEAEADPNAGVDPDDIDTGDSK